MSFKISNTIVNDPPEYERIVNTVTEEVTEMQTVSVMRTFTETVVDDQGVEQTIEVQREVEEQQPVTTTVTREEVTLRRIFSETSNYQQLTPDKVYMY